MKKVSKGGEPSLLLDHSDRDQLDILRVQLNIEREQAMNGVEKEIEDSSDIDRMRMEDELKAKL